MKTIWKYAIDLHSIGSDVVEFEMPADGEILAVQTQDGVPTLWVLVDPLAPKFARRFQIVGTGHKAGEHIKAETHVGTAQTGPFVWHVFEIPL